MGAGGKGGGAEGGAGEGEEDEGAVVGGEEDGGGGEGHGGAAAFPVAMYHQGAGSSAARPRRMRKRGILRRTDMWFMVPFRMARGKGYCLFHGNRYHSGTQPRGGRMPYYGFNLQWIFSRDPEHPSPEPADERALDLIGDWGFNFIRIPMDYRFWTEGFDYFHPDERVLERIDAYIEACRNRGLHVSLNLHRAPGYCINRNDLERHNLWTDREAQDAFVFLWEGFARRYRDIPGEELSFDLLNEPPEEGQYGFTREVHEALMRRTVEAVRAIDPDRTIVIDGVGGGHQAMPELTDLGVIHSGRGYQPMALTHYRAWWWPDHEKVKERPNYPGLVWEGAAWDRETLRVFYRPWLEVAARGVTVHIGEFGCYNQVENPTALRWFEDVISLYREWGWGYALWNFKGPFGVVEHGRPGTRYVEMGGYMVDVDLLSILREGMLRS